MELKDTVELMNSADYKERFIAEYRQLTIRMKKIEFFINKILSVEYTRNSNYIEPKHDCTVELLKIQLNQMERYAKTLRLRAVIENIEL